MGAMPDIQTVHVHYIISFMSGTLVSSLRSAAKGTALVYAGIVIGQAVWFAARLLIVGNLSKEEIGIYSLALAVLSVVSLVAGLGLWDASTRYISIFSGQGKGGEVSSVQQSSLLIGAVSGAVACAVLFLSSEILSQYVFYKPGLAAPLRVLSLCIPALVMVLVLASVLRGRGMIGPRVYFWDFGQPLCYLVFLGLVFLLGLPFIHVMYAYVLSVIAAFLLIAYYGYSKIGINPLSFGGGSHYVKELLRFSVPVLSIEVMFLMFRWADTLMLGRYGSAEDVGVYSISVSLAVFLSMPISALESAFMPIAGELYATQRHSDLARTYRALTKWTFSATLPVFFILFFFPEMTITFLFGERFGDSVLPLRILSVGYLFYTFMGTNSMLLLVMGLSSAVVRVSALGTLLNVLLNYTLIKHAGLGIKGAAISSMVSFLAIGAGYSYVLYRRSGMHPIASGYLKPVIGSAVIGAILYFVAKSLPLHFWMLPLYFVLYLLGYMASLFVTRSLSEEDVFFFAAILKRVGVDPEVTRKVIGKIYKGNLEKIDFH